MARARGDGSGLDVAGGAAKGGALQGGLCVPWFDGVAVAVKLIESLAALGLRTSKVGDYARPLDKEYIGWAAPLAWKRD